MTELTTELLEKFVSDIKTDGMCDITDSQVESALIRLLAYEQAAKNPIGSFHISDGKVEATTDYCRDGEWPVQDGEVLVYAAPVLPKQPELVENLKKVMTNWLAMEPKLAFQPEFTDVMMLLDAESAPAQPVIPEQHELVMKHSSVIAEQLAHVLSGMDVNSHNAHQRAVISCAIYRLNKTAEILQQKTTALIAPEKLDYQSAKELFNYLMNEEETNATVNGWNACRAEMLKAQQNEPQNIPENIPAQPVSNPYKLPSGWKLVPEEATIAMLTLLGLTGSFDFMQQKYKNMLAAALAQESE